MPKLQLPKLGIRFKIPKLGKLSRPGRVLVFEDTGASLHGAVASCTASSAFSLGAVALSSGIDRATAVGEVLAQLKSQSKRRLPATAILLSPCVADTLLSLPVNPKKPRPKPQMAEMVRWELEELAVRQAELWTLGALLMGRGLLGHEQRQELERRAMAEGQRPNAALFRSIVGNADLDECLVLQEQLTGGDEELAAGWLGQTGTGEEEEESFSWLAAGVGAGQCDGWAKACRKHGLFLASLYPRLGACLPLLDPAPDWLVVDVGQEQWAVYRGQGRRIDTVLHRPAAFGRAVAAEVVETVGDLLRPECGRLHLAAPDSQWQELAEALDRAYGPRGLRVVAPGQDDPQPPGADRQMALAGAARHHLGLNGRGLPLVSIAAQPPPPPLWKRKHLWPWVGIGLIVAGLVSLDISMRIQTAGNKAELDRLEIEYERRMQVKKQAEALAAEAKVLEGQLAVRQQELKEAERLRHILDSVVRHRQDLIPGLLQTLGESTGELVMLDLLEESADRNTIYLAGWALTDTDGQQFANILNEQLAPWKYRVKDVKLSRGKGRLGIEGYALNVWLVRTGSPADRKVQATPPQAPPATPAATPPKSPKKSGAKGAQSHG